MAAELDTIAAARRSRDTKRDFRAADAPLPDAAAPDSVDLRRDWQPVPNQGRTASCVGWAVAETLRWHLVEAGRLQRDEPLSPRHIWMSAKETDQREDYPSTFLEEDGTSLKAGLDVVRKHGAVLESELPFKGRLAAGTPEDFNNSAASRRIVSYFNLGDGGPAERFAAWRRWLAHGGPVLVMLTLDKHMATAQLETFDPTSVIGDHAAALFGYGPDHFLLRSSWGPKWGDGGYARMSLDYAAHAVVESYGVIV